MQTAKKRGRPRLDSVRKKQIRYGKIEDTFKRIILEIETKKDKEKIESALKELKKTSKF